MKTITLKPDMLIKTKGFDISIGHDIDKVALLSHSTGKFTPFTAIRTKGRLDKIKRKFKRRLSSSTHFFFENMEYNDVIEIIKILSK